MNKTKGKMTATLLIAVFLLSMATTAMISATYIPQTLNVYGPITQLTTSDGNYLGSFSPDGSKIVYSHDGFLYIMNADGTENNQVGTINGASRPKWTPDGRIYIVWATF